MTRSIVRMFSIVVIVALVGGCAIGPTYKKVSANFPMLAPGEGRIYFYRDHSPFGSAVITAVHLNGETVGYSQPGGFFYIDRPAGGYVASCSTEATHKLTIELGSGESRYVRTRVVMGILVGEVWPVLEDQPKAMKTLAECSYMKK